MKRKYTKKIKNKTLREYVCNIKPNNMKNNKIYMSSYHTKRKELNKTKY